MAGASLGKPGHDGTWCIESERVISWGRRGSECGDPDFQAFRRRPEGEVQALLGVVVRRIEPRRQEQGSLSCPPSASFSASKRRIRSRLLVGARMASESVALDAQ